MRPHRRPAPLGALIDLASRAGQRRRAADPIPPALHRVIVTAAEAAGPLLAELAAQGDAFGVVRVGEALAELGGGEQRTTRALRILDEILSTYRDSPA